MIRLRDEEELKQRRAAKSMPSLEEREALADTMVEGFLAADKATAMMILNDPRSWSE